MRRPAGIAATTGGSCARRLATGFKAGVGARAIGAAMRATAPADRAM